MMGAYERGERIVSIYLVLEVDGSIQVFVAVQFSSEVQFRQRNLDE